MNQLHTGYLSMHFRLFVLSSLFFWSCTNTLNKNLLNFDDFSHYITQFNEGDNELYIQYVPNDSAKFWLKENIPLVNLPDKSIEKIYYFRWWTFRKHIRKTPHGFVFTEFLPKVGWSGKYNTINCPAAHHIYEARWLRNPDYVKDYIHFWLKESEEGLRKYSFWIADAFLAYAKVNPDQVETKNLLPLLIENYYAWENIRRDSGKLMFWQFDGNDGMEISVGGRILSGGKYQWNTPAIRPTINSYMYGDSRALAELAQWIDDIENYNIFIDKSSQLKQLISQRLWHDSLSFFSSLPRNYNINTSPINVRELLGYIPWYFNIPPDETDYARAWKYVLDTMGFSAPFGLTVCERSHPYFEISYEGHECQWNGPSWPFATTQTLKALANFLNNYQLNGSIHKTDYFTLLKQYAKSHQITLEDGTIRPWIDENLNPFTGDWIARTRLKSWENNSWSIQKGGIERGKDYNHSGFSDLIISDLIGLKPSLENLIVIEPLIPETWDWFCLDKVRIHGDELGILWDRNGTHFQRGMGFRIYVNGKLRHKSSELKKVTIHL